MRTPKALRLLSILALVLTFLLTSWQVLAQAQPVSEGKPAGLAPAAPQANPLFNTPRAFGNLEKTTGMAVGDFTGDGFLDVVVSNETIISISPGSFQLFANNGQGQLELSLTIPSPGGGVYAGDFNHDGALDFMGDNQLYLNNGNGEFVAQATGITGSGPAAVGDVNGDGFLDFVIQNELTSTAVYLSLNGTGTFGTPTFYAQTEPGFVVLGDLNGDRRLDMVTGNAVYHNVGPTFNQINTLATTGPMALGDVNDDGSLDIVMGVYDDFNAIYFNNGTGGFPPMPNQYFGRFKDYTTSVELADLNGDGYTDIVTSHENNRPSKYFLNNGFGEFLEEVAFGGEYDNSAVSLADLDNNGTLDAIVTVKERPNFYYLNEGGGGFSFNIPLDEVGSSRDVAMGDIDGDGLLDIVIANYGEDSFIYYNQGAWFAEPEQFALDDLTGPEPDPELALAVAVADLDGDNDLEIIIGGDASYIYHPEDETFTPLLFPQNTADIAVGDFNNDYALDIFVGTTSEDLVYFNDGEGGFSPTADVVLPISDLTDAVAVGDLNGDGYLDLVTGNYGAADYLFLNNGDGTFAEGTQIGGFHNTTSIAIGDLDGDGDLDLVMGYDSEQHYAFFNDGLGEFPAHHAFGDADRVLDLALSDLDRDGDLDLVSANLGRFNFTYVNPGSGRFSNGAPMFGRDDTFAVATGDLDGDSFEDVVVANGGTPNFWHSNGYRLSGSLDNNPPIIFVNRPVDTYDAPGFSSPELVDSQFITIPYVVADYEGDPIGQIRGYYSLDGGDNWQPAVAGNMTPQTNLPTQLVTQDFPGEEIDPGEIITADLTFPGGQTALFEPEIGLHLNHSGPTQLSAALVTSWPEEEGGTTIRLFENLKGGTPGNTRIILSDAADVDIQSTTAVYTFTTYNSSNIPIVIPAVPATITSTLLVVGGPTEIVDVNVINLMGTHSYMEDLTIWLQSPSGTIIELVEEICEDDDNFHLNFDDEAQGWDIPCPPTTNGIYRPAEPLFLFDGEDSNGIWKLIIEDDEMGDGGSLLSWGLKITSAQTNTQGNALPLSGTFRPIDPLYTLNGAPSDITYTLVITKSAPPGPPHTNDTLHMWNIHSTGREHIFMWDTFASGFFGESNNVVFRLEAYAQSQPVTAGLYHYHNSTGGNSQWVYASDTTYPFTARGTQVLVTYEGEPVEDALVYRLPAGQTSGATPLANTAGVPFVTDSDGYLQGRGVLAVGDQLMALAPIDASETVTFTDRYRLYYTNAPINPTTNAPDLYMVNGWGVHELAVSEQNTLTLFDIDLSLEWDARQDPTFLEQLEQDIARASEVLYDVTNGQVALGEVNIYQAKENWTFSHAVVYAANDLRPSANAGGIVYTVTAEVISPTSVITDAYLPGQVRMGPTWGRFGDPGSNLGEDWPRALAHELAHYFFFLPDNYLGVENGQVVPTECYGSFMTDAYSDEYTEFLDETGWTGDCLNTIAESITGRDDWATVQTYWPWLRIDPLVSGPAVLPLAVTEITQIEPAAENNTLDVPFFSLRDAAGQPIIIPAGQGQAYLFKNADTPAEEDDYVVALGTPSGDLVHARGAKPGDRLCVYNYGVDPTQLGCLTIGNTESNMTLLSLGEWQPQIVVSAQNSVTLGITVTQATTGSIYVQVLPATGFTETFPITSPVAMLTPVVGQSNTYATVVNMPYPAADGYVRVWSDSGVQEAIIQYLLSSGFSANRSGFSANRSGFSAPLASSDGKVRIYNVTDIFADTGTLSLQALNESPAIPSWLTLAGQAYRFQSTALFDRSITFEYLQSSVPGGRVYEHVLRIYYSPDEGETWQRLNTRLDIDHNFASAVMPETNNGDGLYMLAATLDMPMLDEGWNLLSYPVPFTRTLPLAVESLGSSYTTIYNNGPTAAAPWQLYDRTIAEEHPELAELVNTLTYVEFGGVYWIYATEAITPYIGLPPEQRLNSVGLELPPATYYGWITPTETFTATAGMTITAFVDGQLCGESVVEEWQGQLAYQLQVTADNGNGCGATGRTITFFVGNQQMGHNELWDNSQAWYHPLVYLAGEIQGAVYLPVLIRP